MPLITKRPSESAVNPLDKSGRTYAMRDKVVYGSMEDIYAERRDSTKYSSLAGGSTRKFVDRPLTADEETARIADRLTELGL